MNYQKRTRASQSGFTIIELMIALSVLAVLLILCTVVLMNIGKAYVKGTNKASAENSARNVIYDISNQIRLGGAVPELHPEVPVPGVSTQGYLCIGSTRYTYLIGRKVENNADFSAADKPTNHALWRDTMMSSSSCPNILGAMQTAQPGLADDIAPGTELIPEDMRLTRFDVTSAPGQTGLYSIQIGIAYGDNDLLCVNSDTLGGGSDCDSSMITANPIFHLNNLISADNQTVSCVSGVGDQFCGVSYLGVTVARRLAGS